ncbi:U32 family peptidase [uncultured Aquabacterium sp.]|uniref:peptidase U32 family protein n=1 Tax=uncultured Aquabacterium sp. TaxID=158753 RepID=UPI00262F58A3|nr:U32 family peptidase [uncultured Aquabacterium sp.]
MPASRHEIELLAPAKTADIGIEAINHGADAVYIGGPSFGARSNASNEVSDIARLVQHAHRYHARIFTTLNTILRDDELEPARKLIWQLYDAGVDALIVQDMGLLQLDLPPIQLHASTQTDIRTVEKAKFLQDVGFSQIVLARELTLQQIREIAANTHANIEFFIHGALCVAYSGQCFISHAHTGRSANRGDCSQACRLPYNVLDDGGQVVAFEQHVLSMKDNDQSANLRALIDAGVSSFKIEGRYKDMGYVKNITAHYRVLLDEILEERPELARASAGECTFFFQPDPDRNFNRGATDYFVNGRKEDIGAFESPKHLGLPIGEVAKVGDRWFDVALNPAEAESIENGDGLNYLTLTKDIVGVQVNTAEPVGKAGRLWRVFPNEEIAALPDLKSGVAINRNRDRAWENLLGKKSAERRIGLWMSLTDTADGLKLTLTDETGHVGEASVVCDKKPAQNTERAEATLREHLGKLGTTIFQAHELTLGTAQPWFVPASVLNSLRRDAVAALEAARAAALQRLPRAEPVDPPVPYPEDTLTYLANVYNHAARDFYAKHGVKVIEAAYESHEELGEVSLMITKHCVRFSLSLCPKQAKGVTGVQGTVKAAPLQLVNGKEKLTLRFDCKPCEMHVVGKMKKSVLNQVAAAPIQFYRSRPTA